MLHHKSMAVTLLALLAALWLGGCDDDDPADGADGGGGMGGGGESVEAWYAFAVVVFGPDTGASYLVGTARLEDETLSLDDAVEASASSLFSTGDGKLFVGDYSTPILTRYAVGTDGRLSEDGRLSFAAAGLDGTGFAPNQIHATSPTRAYYLGTEQVIVWNPEALEIEGTIAVPDLARDGGFAPSIGYGAVRRGDEIVWTVTWGNNETGRVLDETALVVLDTTDDSITVSTKTGCSAAWGGEGSDGSLYFAQGAWPAAVWRLSAGADAPAPCMLAVAPGADAFADEVVDLRALVGGDRVVGTMANVAPGRALIRVFEEDSIEVTPETTASDLTFRADWSWRWVELPSLTVSEAPGLPVTGSGEFFAFQLGDKFVVPAIPATEDSTTVYQAIGPDTPARQVLFTPGNVYGAAKAR